MRTFTVVSLSEWLILSAKLRRRGYTLWQSQHIPGDFYAWFWLDGKEQIEVVTHSEEVKDAIMRYKADA